MSAHTSHGYEYHHRGITLGSGVSMSIFRCCVLLRYHICILSAAGQSIALHCIALHYYYYIYYYTIFTTLLHLEDEQHTYLLDLSIFLSLTCLLLILGPLIIHM